MYHTLPRWVGSRRGVSFLDLRRESSRFRCLESRVSTSLGIPVRRVEKVMNVALYRLFANSHEKCSRTAGAYQRIEEFFYGTGHDDPHSICASDFGLNSPSIQVFTAPMICFAESAKASLKFAYRGLAGERQLLLCYVIVGHPADLPPDGDLAVPMRIDGVEALSTRVKRPKGDVWIVYRKCMTYPAYIVTL